MIPIEITEEEVASDFYTLLDEVGKGSKFIISRKEKPVAMIELYQNS